MQKYNTILERCKLWKPYVSHMYLHIIFSIGLMLNSKIISVITTFFSPGSYSAERVYNTYSRYLWETLALISMETKN